MGRVERVTHSGGAEPNTVAMSQQLDAVLRVVDGGIEFGEPQNPNDPTSTTLPQDPHAQAPRLLGQQLLQHRQARPAREAARF